MVGSLGWILPGLHREDLCNKYSWTLNNTGLNCTGSRICRFFRSIQYSTVNGFSHNFLNDILFSLAYFIVRIQWTLHIKNVFIDYLFSARLSVNNRLLTVTFWGSQKLYLDFQLCVDRHTRCPRVKCISALVSVHWAENSNNCSYIVCNTFIWTIFLEKLNKSSWWGKAFLEKSQLMKWKGW